MKQEEPSSAKEVLENKMKNAMLLEFFLDRFLEFQSDVENWREKLSVVRTEFQAYMKEIRSSDTPANLREMVDAGLLFIASNPLFSISEYAKLGAGVTEAEKKQFMDEFQEIIKQPSKRQHIHPQIAAVGWEVVAHLAAPGSAVAKAIEEKKADIDEMLAVGVLKALIAKAQDPWAKAIQILDKMASMNVSMDAAGNLLDPDNMLEKEQLLEEKQKNARKQSETGTSEEGTAGVPPAPENLN